MNKIKKILSLVLVFAMILSFSACNSSTAKDDKASKDENNNAEKNNAEDTSKTEGNWDESYKIPNVTLCEHDPFDFTLTNAAQFRMRADVYVMNATDDKQTDIFKKLDQAMMIYTTGTLDEVKQFITENVTSSSDIDALDAANRCRLLTKGASSSKLEYLEIDNEESTGFYKVGVDLISMNSICQTPGVYHFYIASIAGGQIKWVEEAQETFEMTQDMIDVRNALIDFVYTTGYETDNEEAANYDIDKKQEIAKESIVKEIGDNISGLEVAVKFVENTSFDVTLTKGSCSQTKTVDYTFGPVADKDAWLVNIKSDHLSPVEDANSFGLTCSFGPAYDDSQVKEMFVCYSSENLDTVREVLMPLSYDEINAMYPEEGDIYLRIRDKMTADNNGSNTYALSSGSKDVIHHDVDMFETEGTYYMYVGVLSDTGVLWIGQLEEPLQK